MWHFWRRVVFSGLMLIRALPFFFCYLLVCSRVDGACDCYVPLPSMKRAGARWHHARYVKKEGLGFGSQVLVLFWFLLL